MSQTEPCMLLIFGATGDLTRRKLLPALFRLARRGTVHAQTPIVCIGREQVSPEAIPELLGLKDSLAKQDEATVKDFMALIHWVTFDYQESSIPQLAQEMKRIEKETGCGPNRAAYLALPAKVFGRATTILASPEIADGGGWRRICYEKPFGHDLESARELDALVARHFEEEQIYRIDHYMGKELVRNLLVLRFSNPLFEQIWNRLFLDHVQITISETLGVEGRGGYYESAGAIRDMLQNHLLQLVALTAMEPPSTLTADALNAEKVKVLRALLPLSAEDLVIGQYGAGQVNGKRMPAYREEPDTDPSSDTETFVAVRLQVENFRWKGVPFFLRTGKAMTKKYAEINVVLREVPLNLFGSSARSASPNVISIRIQPNEGISVRFNVKKPGEGMPIGEVEMDHCHHCQFAPNTPEAYEVLLTEFLQGDQMLFSQWDFVEAAWQWVDPVMAMARQWSVEFPNYLAGSEGPDEAADLLARHGRRWITTRDISG